MQQQHTANIPLICGRSLRPRTDLTLTDRQTKPGHKACCGWVLASALQPASSQLVVDCNRLTVSSKLLQARLRSADSRAVSPILLVASTTAATSTRTHNTSDAACRVLTVEKDLCSLRMKLLSMLAKTVVFGSRLKAVYMTSPTG